MRTPCFVQGDISVCHSELVEVSDVSLSLNMTYVVRVIPSNGPFATLRVTLLFVIPSD